MCLYNPTLRLIRIDFPFGTTDKALFPYFARVTLFDIRSFSAKSTTVITESK